MSMLPSIDNAYRLPSTHGTPADVKSRRKAPDEIRADTGRFLLDGIWGGLEETWKVPGLTN